MRKDDKYTELEQIELSTTYASIPENRRRELDALAELWPTEAEENEEQERWEAYFTEKSKGMSDAEAERLWNDINYSAECEPYANETLKQILERIREGMNQLPQSDIERNYVEWRQKMLLARDRDKASKDARQNANLVNDYQGALVEMKQSEEALNTVMSSSVKQFISIANIGNESEMSRLSTSDFLLMLFLTAKRNKKGKQIPLSFEEISKGMRLSNKMAVHRLEKKFEKKFPELSRLVRSFRTRNAKGSAIPLPLQPGLNSDDCDSIDLSDE